MTPDAAARRRDTALAHLDALAGEQLPAVQISALLVALAGWHRVESAARAAKIRTLAVLSCVFERLVETGAQEADQLCPGGGGRLAGELLTRELVTDAEDLVVAEAAALLSLSRRQVLNLMAEAHILSERLPRTLALLGEGIIERSHVSAMLRVTEGLGAEDAAAIEDRLFLGLPHADLTDGRPLQGPTRQPPTPAQIHRAGSALALALLPEGAAGSEAQVREDKTRVVLASGDGFDTSPGSPACRAGLATLQATMPATDAAWVWATVDAAARLLRKDLRARRRAASASGGPLPQIPSLARLRAQALRDLVCLPAGDPDRPAALRVELQVTMPVTMFGGLMTEPTGVPGASGSSGMCGTSGVPGGNGPARYRSDLAQVDPGSGPQLLLSGRARSMLEGLLTSSDLKLRRLFTWPDGSLALAESFTHDPPDSLDRHIRLRDGTCRAPGCLTPAASSDLDHVVPYQEGDLTHAGNLHALCRHHHRLKTFTRWRPVLDPATGEVTWTSPSGRRYLTRARDYGWLAGDVRPLADTCPATSAIGDSAGRTETQAQMEAEVGPWWDEPPPF